MSNWKDNVKDEYRAAVDIAARHRELERLQAREKLLSEFAIFLSRDLGIEGFNRRKIRDITVEWYTFFGCGDGPAYTALDTNKDIYMLDPNIGISVDTRRFYTRCPYCGHMDGHDGIKSRIQLGKLLSEPIKCGGGWNSSCGSTYDAEGNIIKLNNYYRLDDLIAQRGKPKPIEMIEGEDNA